MSDFTSEFWNWYVAGITIASLISCVALLRSMSTRKVVKDDEGKVANTGHVWDEDLVELNNPLPRWWMNLFYLTLVFAGGYLVLYPGAGKFGGTLNWTSAAEYEQERAEIDKLVRPLYASFAGKEIKDVAWDPQARAIGERLFTNNCAQCHGSDAGGSKGFPSLRDNDWLYGGEPEDIKASITNGRRGMMPPHKASLSEEGIWNVTHYVLSISNRMHNAERADKGRATFQAICSACHGLEGKGNVAVGAPNLTDDVWLYGGSEKTIIETITNGRSNQMPAHKDLLDADRIHLLTAYVYGISHPQATPHDAKTR